MLVKRLIQPNVLSPVFIASCAALMSLETNHLTETPLSFTAATISFLGALVAYSLSQLRLTTFSDHDNGFQISGNQFHLYSCVLGITGLITLAVYLSPTQGMWLSVVATITFLYMFTVNEQALKIKPLRYYLPLKNFLVAFSWTLATVALPLDITLSDVISAPPTLLLFIRRFLFIFCLAVLYDMPDMETDKQEKVGTIPARFGIKIALHVTVIVLILFQILTLTDPHLGLTTSAALTISTLYVAYLIRKSTSSTKRNSFRFMVDSAMILQAAAVLAT